MDIDQLTKFISDIILTRDEVTLPGLGSFVAEEVAASFSDKGYTINPPYRRLSFRPYQGKDNSLAEAFAKSENISVEDALAQLKDFLGKLKEVLKQRKSIIFPGLGHLRATKENNFFFVCDEEIMIYPEGFGLHPVSLKSRVHEPVELEKQAQSEAISRLQKQEAVQEQPKTEQPDQSLMEATAMQKEETSETALSVERQDEAAVESPKKKHTFLKVLLTVVILAVIAVAALLLLARFAPELLDKILYSEEELKILYY
ncbi:MAG: hypothetical protein MJY80_04795 [Bacteroidales bacterium]|nr:hypothetical protein [Bacteroidales bacterium]